MSQREKYKHSYHIWNDETLQWNEVDHAAYLKYKKAHRDLPVKHLPDYPFYFHFIG